MVKIKWSRNLRVFENYIYFHGNVIFPFPNMGMKSGANIYKQYTREYIIFKNIFFKLETNTEMSYY